MTDRHAGYVVTLAHDIREDDAQALIAAIAQLRGVVSVRPIVSNPALHIALMRAGTKYREALFQAIEALEKTA